jgi:hypothetical protein
LTRLYLSYSLFDKAIAELNRVLVAGHQDRIMLNTLSIRDCGIPQLAVDIFMVKAQAKLLTIPEAKYLLLLVSANCQLFRIFSF